MNNISVRGICLKKPFLERLKSLFRPNSETFSFVIESRSWKSTDGSDVVFIEVQKMEGLAEVEATFLP